LGHILIVDAALLDRKRMRNILEAAGHSVVEAASVAEAQAYLEAAGRDGVSLVLAELQFPHASGLDLIHWLKAQGLAPFIPVLVVTAQPPRETVIELVQAGAATVVTKPFSPDLLLRRVTETLAEHQREAGDLITWKLRDYVRRELKRATRSDSPLTVLICRVQGPRQAAAVTALMDRLSRLMRESDVLSRWGDDRLVIVLPDTDAAGAQAVADRLWRIMEEADAAADGGMPLPHEVSIGFAVFPVDAGEADQLLYLASERAVAPGTRNH
jgi:PleD family two-component response regulator